MDVDTPARPARSSLLPACSRATIGVTARGCMVDVIESPGSRRGRLVRPNLWWSLTSGCGSVTVRGERSGRYCGNPDLAARRSAPPRIGVGRRCEAPRRRDRTTAWRLSGRTPNGISLPVTRSGQPAGAHEAPHLTPWFAGTVRKPPDACPTSLRCPAEATSLPWLIASRRYDRASRDSVGCRRRSVPRNVAATAATATTLIPTNASGSIASDLAARSPWRSHRIRRDCRRRITAVGLSADRTRHRE